MLYVMGNIKEDFGESVRIWRKRRGLSGEKLAEAIGITPNSLYSLERGEQWVSAETVEKLARALEINPRDLFDFGAPSARPTPAEALDVLREALEERQAPRTLLRAAEPTDPPEVAFLRSLPPEDPAWDIVRGMMKTKAKGRARKAD
jgi:transcriptional regulator with XRE-family HTH domain